MKDMLDELLEHDEAAVDQVEETSSKPWERNYTPAEMADRAARKAAGEYLPGTKKHKTTYRRKHVTDKDLALMEFVGRFRYATSTQLAHVSGTSWKATHNRLLGIEELRMVRRVEIPGTRILWLLTQLGSSYVVNGTDTSIDQIRLMRPDDVNLTELAHNLAITQTAAWLTKGMPILKNVPKDVALPYSTDALVSEYEMRSAWNKLLDSHDLKGKDRGAIGENLLRVASNEVKERKVPLNRLLNRYPALWTLAADSGKKKGLRQFHYPDLIINREALRSETNPQPQSIAVEVELSNKPVSEVATTLRMFKRDTKIYGHVMWVVNRPSMIERLKQADEEVGLMEAGRMSITWLVGHDGRPYRDKPWKL